MLGLPLGKTEDTVAEGPSEVTKREMLRFPASIYDPLGLVSPVSLVGKLFFWKKSVNNTCHETKNTRYHYKAEEEI